MKDDNNKPQTRGQDVDRAEAVGELIIVKIDPASEAGGAN